MEYKILEKIECGGSDRIFYRCSKENKTYILCWDREIKKCLKLQKHLYDRGIAVPEIHWADEESNLILMEDFGNDSLYKLAHKRKNIYAIYRAAINALVKLQIDGYLDVPIADYYDYEHVKWEQNYFRKNFLQQLCKISTKKQKKLDGDLERLAKQLIKKAKPWTNFLMHRDYQSQNIFIKKRKAKIVDFQSARIGPLSYDLSALLKDAYVNLKKEQEKTLIKYYIDCIKKKGIRIKQKDFLEIYQLSGLQRNMQALGAFANLSLNKNKEHFKKYIPRALQLLQSGLEKSKFYGLYKTVTSPEVLNNVAEQAG
jgi:aminoglycoside/choline kinase family phosphotransferase